MGMSFRDVIVTSLVALFLTLVTFVGITLTSAQVMQSTNYRIESDSINFGGGFSSSTNYILESTAGEQGTGDLTSTNYGLRAGYQQMVNSFISMTAPGNVSMTPDIVGITGGVANGSTTVTVTTDSAAGYQLTVKAGQSPAMVSGANSIADYAPGGDPDFTFSTGAGEAQFGYSPSGTDIVQRFKDNGSACNAGAGDTALACWDGLDTIGETVARSSAANNPTGATTTLHFRVWIGGGVNQAPGTYTATTTLTAVSL